ncbi:hypothetical protein F2Q70_00003115 [Brassica cretica]|uniref:Uncharacterized protein n=1 Tax=Brassica cretica TaxID=69181 RepID=A0A8S9IUA7_BRACR|nr:hypothetical protein F2Q70_00003115 [Brassica cretica]
MPGSMRTMGVDGFGWIPWGGSTYGNTKLPTARVYLALRSRSTTIDYGEYAPAFDMLGIWDRLLDRHD